MDELGLPKKKPNYNTGTLSLLNIFTVEFIMSWTTWKMSVITMIIQLEWCNFVTSDKNK